MDLYTSCYIPSLKKEIDVNAFTFGDYYKLNNYIQNSDYIKINRVFNEICEKSFNRDLSLTNLDKFSLILHLKRTFSDPILKISAKDLENNSISYEIILNDIFKNIKKYNFENFNLPKNLYYSNVDDILEETKESFEKIKEHIDQNKIKMFNIPEIIKGIPSVYINCFDNTLFYFCKLIMSTNLINLYKKIAFLKKTYNFSLSEIYEMNLKELDIFLKLNN